MLAIYRKYRPKKLEDVLGQEAITTILKNASKADGLGHAYLFYGPRGSGKTTTARILAKLVNCETRIANQEFRAKGEPCNDCRVCREIDDGRALDIVEIDAASNRGIDEIRDLKEGIKFSPTSYRCKVFIIDEAHQLTKEAFNALLKTLEEPPDHAIFILATTEFEKMPVTIISRTQRFHFKRLPRMVIAKKLKEVAEAEKIKIEEPAIELISAAAEGSFRDAESLLDQIASLRSADADGIKAHDIERIIGKAPFGRLAEIAELLMKKDLSASLEYLSKISEDGYDPVQFNKDLIHYLRRVLALRFSPGLEKNFSEELTDHELELVKKQSARLDDKLAISLIKSLIRAYTEMRYTPFTMVPMEVAIIENLK